jgi:hypothetical protein
MGNGVSSCCVWFLGNLESRAKSSTPTSSSARAPKYLACAAVFAEGRTTKQCQVAAAVVTVGIGVGVGVGVVVGLGQGLWIGLSQVLKLWSALPLQRCLLALLTWTLRSEMHARSTTRLSLQSLTRKGRRVQVGGSEGSGSWLRLSGAKTICGSTALLPFGLLCNVQEQSKLTSSPICYVKVQGSLRVSVA